HIRFGDGRAIHPGIAVKPPHRLAPTDAAHVVFDRIARHYGFTKLALVDGEKIDRAGFFGTGYGEDADHAGRLRHRLDHHDTRINRIFRKMAEERHFAESDVLDADAAVVGPDVDDAIDQQ